MHLTAPITLIIFQSLRKITEIFLSSFLIAFLFTISQENIVPVTVYYIVFSLFLVAFFIILGDFVKRKNKLLLLRIGILLNLFYLSMIVILGNNADKYVVLLGVIYGIASAFYWLPVNVIISETVNNRNMHKFTSYKNAVSGIVAIAAPFILGIVITIGSFRRTAAFLIILTCTELWLSFHFKSPSLTPEKFNMRGFLKYIKHHPLIKRVYFVDFMNGLALSSVLNIGIVLYTVYIFKTNLNLGILTSIFSIATVAISLLFGKFATAKMYPSILFFSSIFAIFASFFFVLNTNRVSFILYNLSYAAAVRLLLMILDINLFNVSNTAAIHNKYRVEYMSARELFLNSGRISGYILLLLVGITHNFELLKYLLLVLTFGIGIMGYCSIKINREMNKE